MKTIPYLIIAFALAIPSMVMAQGTPAKTPPTQPAPTQPTEAKQQATEANRQAEVKGYVLPIVVGIRSAEMSATALQELSNTEPFERRDARRTADIAEEAVKVAHERAQDLHKMKGLSAADRSEAETAVTKLKDARSSVDRIQRQVGTLEAPFRKHEAENVRKDAAQLQTQLSDAQKAIQRIADSYRVSTNLELTQRTTPQR